MHDEVVYACFLAYVYAAAASDLTLPEFWGTVDSRTIARVARHVLGVLDAGSKRDEFRSIVWFLVGGYGRGVAESFVRPFVRDAFAGYQREGPKSDPSDTIRKGVDDVRQIRRMAGGGWGAKFLPKHMAFEDQLQADPEIGTRAVSEDWPVDRTVRVPLPSNRSYAFPMSSEFLKRAVRFASDFSGTDSAMVPTMFPLPPSDALTMMMIVSASVCKGKYDSKWTRIMGSGIEPVVDLARRVWEGSRSEDIVVTNALYDEEPLQKDIYNPQNPLYDEDADSSEPLQQDIYNPQNPLFDEDADSTEPLQKGIHNHQNPLYDDVANRSEPLQKDIYNPENPLYDEDADPSEPLQKDIYNHQNPLYDDVANHSEPLQKDIYNPENPLYEEFAKPTQPAQIQLPEDVSKPSDSTGLAQNDIVGTAKSVRGPEIVSYEPMDRVAPTDPNPRVAAFDMLSKKDLVRDLHPWEDRSTFMDELAPQRLLSLTDDESDDDKSAFMNELAPQRLLSLTDDESDDEWSAARAVKRSPRTDVSTTRPSRQNQRSTTSSATQRRVSDTLRMDSQSARSWASERHVSPPSARTSRSPAPGQRSPRTSSASDHQWPPLSPRTSSASDQWPPLSPRTSARSMRETFNTGRSSFQSMHSAVDTPRTSARSTGDTFNTGRWSIHSMHSAVDTPRTSARSTGDTFNTGRWSIHSMHSAVDTPRTSSAYDTPRASSSTDRSVRTPKHRSSTSRQLARKSSASARSSAPSVYGTPRSSAGRRSFGSARPR